MHATMETEAFFEEQGRSFFSHGDVHVEALGNPLQTAFSLASSCYDFTDTAAAGQSHSLELQQASGSPLMRSGGVSRTPAEADAATTGGLLPEIENADLVALAAGRGGEAEEGGNSKEEDSRMRERSVEKRCSVGDAESSFFVAEVEGVSGSSSNSNRSGNNPDNSSTRGASSSAPSGSGGQQQQDTSCEEEVTAEQEVETADGNSTATEVETEADSQFCYSEEESEDERDEDIDEEEEERFDKSASMRSVVFCDAFAGLEGGKMGGEQEGRQQQPQQARATGAAQTAAATPTRERGKRKFSSAACDGSDGVMVSQEKRGRKGGREESFDLPGRIRADVEHAAEHRHSSRRARKGTVHATEELLLETGTNPAVWSRAFYSPGCKRRNSRSIRDADSGAKVLTSSSSMQWQSSRGKDLYDSRTSSRQQGSATGDSSDLLMGSGSKRRNSSRSVGGQRFKVRRRVSEAETYSLRSSSCSSFSSDRRAATAVIAGSLEHSSIREDVSSTTATAAIRQTEAAEADPLTRLARRTEELLLMHSKRFMEEQQK